MATIMNKKFKTAVILCGLSALPLTAFSKLHNDDTSNFASTENNTEGFIETPEGDLIVVRPGSTTTKKDNSITTKHKR